LRGFIPTESQEQDGAEQGRAESEEWGDYQNVFRPEKFYAQQYANDPEEFNRQFNKISPYSTSGVDPALIRFVCNAPNPDLLYSFVNTIAALPLATELIDYNIGLYATNAMETIISELKPTFGNEYPWRKRYNDEELGKALSKLEPSSGKQTPKERFDVVTARVETFRSMHQVNKNIITDATDAFVQAAAIITPVHLQTLMDIKGVPVMMRLFEPNYQSLLTGKDGRVTGENDAMMLGKETVRNELNEAMASLDRSGSIVSIEDQLRELVKQAKGYKEVIDGQEVQVPPNPYLSDLANMRDWEIRLAADSAKILQNLTLRSIEHISHNKVNEKAPLQGFTKERAARIFSLILEVKRFGSGEETAGMEYFNRVLEWYQKLREKHGYGTTHITKLFGGKAIGDYEAQGLLRSGSMFATWRGRGSIIDKAPLVVDGKLTSIGRYIDGKMGKRRNEILAKLGEPELKGVWDQIKTQMVDKEGYKTGDGATQGEQDAFEKEFKARFKVKFEERTHTKKGPLEHLSGFNRFNRQFERRWVDEQPKLLREIFLVTVTNPDGSTHEELRPEFTNAYGTLYKLSDITPTETDFQVPGLFDAKKAVREAIWRKMADENPVALAFLMSGMDFDGKGEFFTGEALDKFRLFARRLNPDEPDPNPSPDPSGHKKYTYRDLLRKLNTANEIRLAGVEQEALRVNAEQLERDGEITKARAIREKLKDKPAPKLSLSEIFGEGEFQVPLTREEAELLRQIRKYGKDVAGELTTVRFPYIPIMNDITWGSVDFNESGAIFYSRQIGDDVSRFNGWKDIEKFQRNPNVMDPFTDVIEVFKNAKEKLTGPNGTGGSQDILLPFEFAHWDMIQAGSQFGDKPVISGVMKFLASNMFIKEFAHIANKSNSIAQVWGRVDAPAIGVTGMNDLINLYAKNALIRSGDKIKGADGRNKYSDIYNLVRKKYRIQSWGIPFWLLAIMGDLFLPVVIGGTNEVRKKAVEGPK
jgi:hypothetical protein